MTDRPIKVAVIIVTYNSTRFLEDCFGSLSSMTKEGLEAQVIVIDNGSTDGSAEKAAAWRFAMVTKSTENLGFAGGNNRIIRHALDAGADYVYLLNHDTEVTPGFLVEAVETAEADERIGSVQSLILLSPDKERINSTGNAIHFLGFGYCNDYRRTASSWPRPANPEIAYASGAGVLYRASALKEVGLLDEELFMYHEDLDLGWRLRLAGYRNVLAPASVIYHKYEFSRSITKYFWMERNRYVVLFKNARLWTLILLAPFLLVSELALFAISLVRGWWREKLKVYKYFFTARAWKHVGRERAAVKKLRKVGDREIVRLFTSTIGYQEVASPFVTYVANPLMALTWAVLRFLVI
jgi:GT2 family glycosyltransferase